MHETTFPYRPNLVVFSLGFLFFAFIAIVSFKEATVQSALALHHMEPSTNMDTILSWSGVALGTIFSILFLLLLVSAFINPREILMTSDEITIPGGPFSKKTTTLKFIDILDLKLLEVGSQRTLSILYAEGNLKISAAALGGSDDLDVLCGIIKSKVKISSQSIKKNEKKFDQKTAAIMYPIRERENEDPLIGAKLGGKEIFTKLLDAMKDEKGVHVQSLLCALGALAGYSCQASLRAQAIAEGLAETEYFQIIRTVDGKQYFFGDGINKLIAENHYSVWTLAGGAVEDPSSVKLIDLVDIFKYTTSMVGDENFGIPRVPENHSASDTPINYLKALWEPLLPTVKLFCPDPGKWPILYGIAIQEAMDAGKDAIDSIIALRIVMESAIPMSKIDLENT